MLDKFIESEEAKPVLDKHFVVAHLTVPDSAGNAGASKILEQVGGHNQGMPFHAFLNSKGDLIVNSKRNGQSNIGYPYEPHEIDWFMVMAKKAAPGMTSVEANMIETKLRSYKQK
ncbi:MAG: hypothetical protein HY735_15490 [Verrucomicrobia bacterium]|nr:hypothetical protein [Verrucomicrobiota bacterium]